MPNYYNVHEAAQMLGVSDATLRRWIKKARIDADVTVSGQYRLTDDQIDAARPRPVERRAART